MSQLWSSPISGADLKSSGFTVFLNKVPTNVPAWDVAPFEAQYLKLVDVTDPPAIEVVSIGGNGADVELTVTSEPGWYYHLETSIDLINWVPVQSNVVASGSETLLVHSGGAADVRRFYRGRVSAGAL